MSLSARNKNEEPPPYEFSVVAPPGGVHDPGTGYTDLAAIPADSSGAVGLYPEVIITEDDDNDGPAPLGGIGDGPLDGSMSSTLSQSMNHSKARLVRPDSSKAYIQTDPTGVRTAKTRTRGHLTKDGIWHTEQSTTVVVNQPPAIIAQSAMMRPPPRELVQTDHKTEVKCFNCGEEVTTYIYYEAGAATWVACFGLCIIGCMCGCCLCPFFVKACKDLVHKCPKCHVILGKHKKLS